MKILFGHAICQNVGNALPFLEGNSLKFMNKFLILFDIFFNVDFNVNNIVYLILLFKESCDFKVNNIPMKCLVLVVKKTTLKSGRFVWNFP